MCSLFSCKSRETNSGNRIDSTMLKQVNKKYPNGDNKISVPVVADTIVQKVNIPLSVSDSLIRRLSPNEFHLPESISIYLNRERYTIPQTFISYENHNVIVGSFRNREQRDWAVLASRNHSSSILVFWNGSPSDMSEIALYPDSLSIRNLIVSESIPEDSIGYIREIKKVSEHIVALTADQSKSISSLLITHDGIENSHWFEMSIYYNHNGKWILIPVNE
jgi:hypothetical protein